LLESNAGSTFIVHGCRSVGLSCVPPWPWALCAWPSRVAMNDATPSKNLLVRDPLSFASSSKTRSGLCGSSVLNQHRPVRRLSVPTIPVKLPLLWFSKDRPSTDINFMRPVPTSHSKNDSPSVPRCQTCHAFRPCCSSQLRRFTPHTAL
jgi:hypothetical protein